jgi:hypothetical protein
LQGYKLAEMLFNLQEVDGFPILHSRLLAGEIEAVIGELEAATFLKRRGERFRFIKPTGNLGGNYDLEILRKAGTICCEVKTKLESEVLTVKGVLNSLENARKQLPKDQPGLIFIRIGGSPDRKQLTSSANLVHTAAKRLFGQTSRIVGILLLTREYSYEEDQVIVMWDLWRAMPNPNSIHPLSLLEPFREASNFKSDPGNWNFFIQLRRNTLP